MTKKRTEFGATAFNTRRLSPVFSTARARTSTVWVDRVGVKTSLTEYYSGESKGTLSLIAESISCLGATGAPCISGERTTHDTRRPPGPPTTLSNSGSDKIFFLHGDLVRDASYDRHGVLLGDRDIFTVDQGVGIGSGFPLFNRHTVSITRFIPLPHFSLTGKAPASLVLHGKFGNCIGDIASYDYFILGGPFSCRGYNIGELGSARRFFETAVEMRHPLPLVDGQVYSFLEHADSMGCSKEMRGNPNEFYSRSGRGTSWGYGVKFRAVRFEYAQDCNLCKGTWFIRFGERF